MSRKYVYPLGTMLKTCDALLHALSDHDILLVKIYIDMSMLLEILIGLWRA